MKKAISQATLLDYAIDTVPDPLQASVPGTDPVMAVLTLIVSNSSGKPVTVSNIVLSMPIGSDSDDLTEALYAKSIMVRVDPERLWNVSQVPDTPGTFMIQPATGQPITITDTGVVFQFFNITVNNMAGTFNVNIVELATQTAAIPEVPASTQIPLTKFPYGFFFSNLVPNVPAVQNGGQVTLTWQGSTQARYFMLYNDQQIDVSNVRSWTSPALTRDTTFLLKALSESNGEEVERGLSATVNVYNPDLQISSLTVSGNTNMSGTLNVGDTLVVNADATVSGNTTLNGTLNIGESLMVNTDVNVTGNTIMTGTLTVNSAADFESAQVNNDFVANAGVNIRDLTVSNSTTLQGLEVMDVAYFFASVTMDSTLNVVKPIVDSSEVDAFSAYFPSLSCDTISVQSWNFFQNDQQFLQGNFKGAPVILARPGIVVSNDPEAINPSQQGQEQQPPEPEN